MSARQLVVSIIQKPLSRLGYRLQSTRDAVIDKDERFQRFYPSCQPLSVTTRERLYSLYQATEYVVKAKIPGDFIECGVYKGGAVMMIAYTLKALGVTDRKIYLYDTFEGMTPPTAEDVHVGDPTVAAKDGDYDPSIGLIEDVKRAVLSTGYPEKNFIFVKGRVEDTIPNPHHSAIALLRLDTDWYESTRHELNHLYPLLSKGGVLIIDDYGAWAGAKKAVDDYFATRPLLFNRTDHDSRLAIKF